MLTADFLSLFRQAAPYIHAHRNKTFVIHFDADFSHPNLQKMLYDCALLQSLGIHLVLVHGMRWQIEENLAAAGLDSTCHDNKRITTKKILPQVLNAAGSLRLKIEAILSTRMANSPMQDAAVRVSSGNFLTAQPLGVIDGRDFGFTGCVRRINTTAIRTHLELGEIVLVSPLGYSLTGEAFNLNSEEVASAVAVATQADKLIYVSDGVDGYIKSGAPRQLTPTQVTSRKMDNIWLEQRFAAAADACARGIRRVHLVEREDEGALLRELFTRDGIGIMITTDSYDVLRGATTDDIDNVLALIQPLEEKGILIKRSRAQLERDICHFYVLIRDGSIIACAALYRYPENKMAELACLAVDPQYRQHRRADYLLRELEIIARRDGAQSLFVLTTQTAHWFEERGFKAITVAELPREKRTRYDYARNSSAYRKSL